MKSVCLAALITVLSPVCSLGCSCDHYPSIEEELTRCAAIFVGTVVDEATTTLDLEDRSKVAMVAWSFRIDRLLLGLDKEMKTVVVVSPRDEAACGYGFVHGGRYLVYALSREGKLETSICHRTGPFDEKARHDADVIQALLEN